MVSDTARQLDEGLQELTRRLADQGRSGLYAEGAGVSVGVAEFRGLLDEGGDRACILGGCRGVHCSSS